MLKIIEKSKIWFSLSLIVIIAGLIMLPVKKLNYGIDFTGGTVVVIDMGKPFEKQEVTNIVTKYAPDAVTNTAETTQIEIKSNALDSSKISEMFKEIKDKYSLQDTALVSQEEIGSSIGKELTQKALTALIIATIAMLIYVGFRFEFKFGAAAIIALVHDVLTTLTVYVLFQIPLNSPFIAAMLTIIGYSINDTIVIFDRIRENSKTMRGRDITEIANKSITETMTRSINTVFTTLLTIVAVYYFVPSVRDFAFPLIIGILSGAYSSIFIASPLWVIFKKSAKSKVVRA